MRTAVPRRPSPGLPVRCAGVDQDAAVFVTAPPGPAVDGAVTVIDLDEPLLIPMQELWQPHTNSAVCEMILR
ncbi:MAG: hypothetical protein ABI215_05945 [Mycobacterium sp.]